MARQNRGAPANAKVIPLDNYRDSNLTQRYQDWHWGVGAKNLLDWPDPDYPDEMVECGRMVELRVRQPGQRRTTNITLTDAEANKSHLCFDPNHPAERLYVCTSPAVRQDAKVRFWANGPREVWDLNDLAVAVGGRHATEDYPEIPVKLVGALTDVVYFCHKKGDDDDGNPPGSFYIHKLGEESGQLPALAVDARGRFWVVGGNYTAPTPGITD